MNTQDNNRIFDALSFEMTKNILVFSEDPGKAVEKLLEEIRELTGAKIVALYKSSQGYTEGNKSKNSLVGINPSRKKDSIDQKLFDDLTNLLRLQNELVLVSEENHISEYKKLCKAGFHLSLLLPLEIKNIHYGGFLILGLPTKENLEIITNGLESLSETLALIFRSAMLYTGLEELVNEQTESLRLSEKKFRSVFENSSVGKSMTGMDGSLKTNKAFSEMLGYSKEELQSKNWKEITHPDDVQKSEEVVAVLLKGEYSSFRFEKRYIHKNGSVIWADVNTALYKDEHDEPSFFMTSIADITNKKRQEKIIKDSEMKWQTTFDGMRDSVFLLDPHGLILKANKISESFFGKKIEGIIGKRCFEVVHEGTDHIKGCPLLKARLSKKRESIILPVGEKWFKITVDPILDNEGNVQNLVHTVSDISKNKRLEDTIAFERDKFNFILQKLPIGISVLDNENKFTYVNETSIEFDGYRTDPQSIIGKHVLTVHSKDKRAQINQILADFNSGNRSVFIREAKRGKRVVEIAFHAIHDENENYMGLVRLISDITQRKQADMILQAQYNIARAMTVAVNLETLFKKVREELADIIDVTNFYLAIYDKKNGLFQTVVMWDEKVTAPDSWPVEKSLTGRVIQQKKSLLLKKKEINKLIEKGEYETIGVPAEIWLGIPLFDEEDIVGVLSLQNYEQAEVYNVSTIQMLEVIARGLGSFISRKQSEAGHERLSAAIEQSAEIVVITDADGIINYVNPAFEQVTGYSSTEVLGQNPRILKSGEQSAAFYKKLWDTISDEGVWRGKIINRRKDRSLFTVESTISAIVDSAGKIANYVSVMHDITKEQILEQQFRQAQKMDSVGRLAGGVAHDFNNMLAVILGYSEIMLAGIDPADKLFAGIQEINKAGQRSADLTKQLLAFSRKQTIAPQILDLNDIVGKMLKMLRRLIGEDIELTWISGANLSNIKIDPTQIDQLLANLCVNARDAIESNGKVIIETKNVPIDESYCETHAYANPGNYILLSVSDDGCGMLPEIRDKIFEPFFTTKAQGKGTGLGLATVYGIVKQNDGFISVYSEPKQGTSFKIYIPRHGGPELEVAEEETMNFPEGNGELIMLVEDEAAILEMAKTILEQIGYIVITANSPLDALKLAQQNSQKIDLLMTDVVMPELNGKELANRMNTLFPEMKVLFMSGYTSEVIANRGVLDEGIQFISKPFTLPNLAIKLNELFTP